MRMILAIFAMLAAGNLMAAPPDGIPRDLARQRATQISDLRYHLRFTLTPHTPSISGHEDLQFHSRFSGPLLLDFRGWNGREPDRQRRPGSRKNGPRSSAVACACRASRRK